MVVVYSIMFNNVNLDCMIKYRVDFLVEGKCDGVFYYMNRSCKFMSLI